MINLYNVNLFLNFNVSIMNLSDFNRGFVKGVNDEKQEPVFYLKRIK